MLTEEQKRLVEENHNLIYWYCHKYNLNIEEYYGNIHGKMYKFVEKAIKIQLGLWRGGEYERY